MKEEKDIIAKCTPEEVRSLQDALKRSQNNFGSAEEMWSGSGGKLLTKGRWTAIGRAFKRWFK